MIWSYRFYQLFMDNLQLKFIGDNQSWLHLSKERTTPAYKRSKKYFWAHFIFLPSKNSTTNSCFLFTAKNQKFRSAQEVQPPSPLSTKVQNKYILWEKSYTNHIGIFSEHEFALQKNSINTNSFLVKAKNHEVPVGQRRLGQARRCWIWLGQVMLEYFFGYTS